MRSIEPLDVTTSTGSASGVRTAFSSRLPAVRKLVRTRSRAPLDLLRIAAIALVFCYVYRIQDLFSILTSIKFAQLVSVAALALYVVSPPALSALKRLYHPIVKWSLVLFVLIVLSVPGSLWPGNSLNFVINEHVKTMLMMLVVVGSIRSFVDVERYAAAQVLGGVIYSLFANFYFQIGSDGRLDKMDYYDANDLGMLLVGTLPLVLYFCRRGAPIRVRVAALFAGGLFAMAIVRTGSRGAFLGIIAVAVVGLLTFRTMPVRSRIVAVVAGVLAISLFATDQYWSMMRTLQNPQNDYNWSGKSDQGRMEIWKRGIGYMWDRPLTGVGARSFATAEGTISPLAARQNLGRGLRWAAPHNAFVEIGAELGIPGLLVFLAMLVAAFRATGDLARRRLHDDPGRDAEAAMAQSLRVCMVGYVVTAFFLSQGYSAFLYSVLGLIAGFSAVARIQDGARVPRWSIWWKAAPRRAGAR